jgi:hypothetical protein
MPRKPAPNPKKSSDPEEYKRFLEAARESEASEDPKTFNKAFSKVTSAKRLADKHKK